MPLFCEHIVVRPGVGEQPGRLTTVEVTFVLETFVTPSEVPCISAISFSHFLLFEVGVMS